MTDIKDYTGSDPVAWCPGCGNFGILNAFKKALSELDIKPEKLLMVSGIGQAPKLPHYMRCNEFNGLHGRSLPVAAGAVIANRQLTVVVVGGDGDGYAEGGNHFIHAVRRNPDITYLVHNNQVYGLTKGQASPTTGENMVTGTTPRGVVIPPENPLALAVAGRCSFAARGFVGEKEHLVHLIKEGIRNRGFSFIDILQPCVTFNKVNTYVWYRERVYKLDEGYDPYDTGKAFEKAREWGDKIPIGIIYRDRRRSHGELTGINEMDPLASGVPKAGDMEKVYNEFR